MSMRDSSIRNDCSISTYSGKQLDLLAPDASQIDIEDIAHGLAYQCCFNGQTRYFYSMAQHGMLVAQLVPPPHRLAALLHDGAAAYFGDLTPAMRKLLPELHLIEKKVMAAVSEKFSLGGFDAPAIKRAHRIALATEQRDLQRQGAEPAERRDPSAPIPRRIEALPPEEAKYQFTELFAELLAKNSPSRAAGPVVDSRPAADRPQNTRPARMVKTSPAMPMSKRDLQVLPTFVGQA